MRAGTLTWMALRELWISFRFLALLAVGLSGGIAATALAPQGWAAPTLVAWGGGAAGVVAAGLAASGIAGERRSGRVAWLSVRSVPRSATLLAWFGSMALPLLLGLATSALLGWLVTGPGITAALDPPGYAAVALAAAVVALEALALGVAAGCFLAPRPAAAVAVLASAALLAIGLATSAEPPVLPSAGMGLLAGAAILARPVSDGLQATGLALAGTGLLLAVAAAALARADL
jgi:hypothetical protein